MVLAGLCSRGPNVNNKEMRMKGQGGQKEVSKCSLNLDHRSQDTCDFRAIRDVRDHQPPNYKRENQAWQGHMIWWRID